MIEPLILIRDLYKSYQGQPVLAGVSLSVARGETLSVLGQSGAGKSVLLRLIIGLQTPDSGSISVLGQDLAGLGLEPLNEIRKRIGFLFQQAALYDSLTVEENIAFPMDRHLHLTTAQRNDRVRGLLADVGMEEHLHKLPAQISGGMQKRVGLARALAMDPEILLFDEPTAGLDPITAEEIDRLILALKKRRGITSIVVTHDIHAARMFSDRLALLREGKIVAEGTFEALDHSQDPFVARFVNGHQRVESEARLQP